MPSMKAAMTLTFPHNYQSTLEKCVIRVGDQWYDCTAWRHAHPGGAEIIDQFHNKDATDAFLSLHSDEALEKLKKMKGKPVSPSDPPRDTISIKFEEFRQKLIKDGWYERNWFIDFGRNVIPVFLLCLVGTMISYTYPLLATLLIGLGMQQAGWVGHDYTHGRGKLSRLLGDGFGGLINGFSARWWSQKHNTHHTFPNRKEYDADIHNEPILHLWFPDKDSDVWWRRHQHHFYLFAYSLLYVSWRMQSLQFVLGSKNWVERSLIVINYIWLACLPWKVAVGSIIVGGFCVAMVVTVNHQTEEILEPSAKYNFIADQYKTTRGVHTPDPFSEYFFGGLQYQLEHHLFPTMPRYRYPALRKLVQQFAKENNLQCHVSSIPEIMRLNYEVMRKFSQDAPNAKRL